jgi:hypothetical protein
MQDMPATHMSSECAQQEERAAQGALRRQQFLGQSVQGGEAKQHGSSARSCVLRNNTCKRAQGAQGQHVNLTALSHSNSSVYERASCALYIVRAMCTMQPNPFLLWTL